MKRILFTLFVLVSVPILSGCSLAPSFLSSEEDNKGKVVAPGDKTADSPLEDKVVVGSIWKSNDGGNKFESMSKIDKASLALSGSEQEGKVGEVTSEESKPDDGKDENNNGTIDNNTVTKTEDLNGNIISTADILSIFFHPAKPKVVYVSTANDGLFMTDNAGEFWKPIPFPPKNVYSFILDRNNPDNRMFASGVVGDWGKVFRTEDAGKNWEEVYTEPGEKVPVTAMSQHIKDYNMIFAGTKNGTVIKSVDSGDTWKNVGQLEDYLNKGRSGSNMEEGKKITGNVSDFAFDSKNKNGIYMITYGGKLYYSRNAGDRWLDWELEKRRELQRMRESKASSESIKKYSDRTRNEKMPTGIVSVAADTTIPGLVYVGTKKGLFVSDSYGKWWKEVTIIESAKKYPIRSIAMNPKQPKEIVFVSERAFYKSIDSGKTWSTVGLDVNRDVSFVSYDPFDSNYLFVGLRSFKK